jgi:hypothetical protein
MSSYFSLTFTGFHALHAETVGIIIIRQHTTYSDNLVVRSPPWLQSYQLISWRRIWAKKIWRSWCTWRSQANSQHNVWNHNHVTQISGIHLKNSLRKFDNSHLQLQFPQLTLQLIFLTHYSTWRTPLNHYFTEYAYYELETFWKGGLLEQQQQQQ